jgi:hypothetical protein
MSPPLGYFGTGVGAGIVLLAAARQPAQVAAVVTRGRPSGHRSVRAPPQLSHEAEALKAVAQHA